MFSSLCRQHTPLCTAVDNGHIEVCKLLIMSGADVEAKNCERCAFCLSRYISSFHNLLTHFLSVVDLFGYNQWGHRGRDPTYTSRKERMAMHICAEKGHVEICKLLIAAGANVNAGDDR
jgi:ankyrin repeat protein